MTQSEFIVIPNFLVISLMFVPFLIQKNNTFVSLLRVKRQVGYRHSQHIFSDLRFQWE